MFCSTCGSGLPFVDKSGDALFIPTGTLNTVPAIRPEANIFWEERVQWLEHGITAPKQQGFID